MQGLQLAQFLLQHVFFSYAMTSKELHIYAKHALEEHLQVFDQCGSNQGSSKNCVSQEDMRKSFLQYRSRQGEALLINLYRTFVNQIQGTRNRNASACKEVCVILHTHCTQTLHSWSTV